MQAFKTSILFFTQDVNYKSRIKGTIIAHGGCPRTYAGTLI